MRYPVSFLFQLIDPYDFFMLNLCEIMLALLLFEAHYLISMFRCFGQFVVPGGDWALLFLFVSFRFVFISELGTRNSSEYMVSYFVSFRLSSQDAHHLIKPAQTSR